MDLFLHRNAIKEIKENYKKLTEKLYKVLIILTIFSIFLTITLLILKTLFSWPIEVVFIPSLIILVFGIAFAFIWYEYKKDDFFYKELTNLLTKIIRLETNFDISQNNDKLVCQERVLETKFANKGEPINVKSSLDFEKDGIMGSLMLVHTTTVGEHQTDIITGFIVSLNVPTSLELQIRTDHYQYSKYRKSKLNQSIEYTVYHPKSNDDVEMPNYVCENLKWLKNNFEGKFYGIDYQKDKVSFFISETKMTKLPKNFEEEKIEELCNKYIHYLEKSKDFVLKINDEFKW